MKFVRKMEGLAGSISRHYAVVRPRLTLSRLTNIGVAGVEMFLGRSRVRARPFMAKIEASSACNLRCRRCRTGNNIFSYGTGTLRVEHFELMMEKLGKHLVEVILYLWGEPTINKNLPTLIDTAHRWNVAVGISTNLHFLTEHLGARLIESKLDKMVFCMDGLSQESYGEVRIGGNLDLIRENISRFIAQRREAGAEKPLLEWQYVVTDKTKKELPEARKLAKDWGVDRFVEILDWSHRQTDEKEHFERLARAKKKRRHRRRCFWLWTSINIQYDGAVFPCCHTANRKTEDRIYGNILQQDLDSIWNGEKYRMSRLSVTRRRARECGGASSFVCGQCTTPSVFIDKGDKGPAEVAPHLEESQARPSSTPSSIS